MDPPRPTLLIVDDAPESLHVLSALLRPHYRVLAATSGAAALRIAQGTPTPELILLDVMMPVQDGHAVLARLRADARTRDIPVVFLTALSDAEDEERGLRLGAADYIAKPIRPAVVLARVRTQLEAKQARDLMRDRKAALEAEVQRRVADNDLSQRAAIQALAHLAETRDNDTGKHIIRTQHFVARLATGLQGHPRFSATLDARYIDLVSRSAPLHDIGKVGIPDYILLKPGKLTDEEFAVMKGHTTIGHQILVGSTSSVLGMAAEIALHHHEKFDGSGYPIGLAGEAIPLVGRIVAVADVFDALTSERPYKKAWEVNAALDLLKEQSGRHFDPDCVEAFMADLDRVMAIRAEHLDAAESA